MSRPAGPEAATGPTLVPLARNRGFRLLWVGQVVSDTGTEAALIAYPLLVLALTHSPAIAGLVGTARMAVQLVLGLPGGAVSDRLDRRRTMVVCDSRRAAALALLAVLVLLGMVTWPVVLAVAVIDGGLNVLFDPSASAAPRLQGRLPLRRLVIVGTTVGTVLFGIAAVLLPSTLVALPVAVSILLAPVTSSAVFAAMQRATPQHMRGRVNSTMYQVAMSLAALAPLTAGLLVEHASGQWAMAAFAAAMGVSAIVCGALPGLKNPAGLAVPGGTQQEPPPG